jgi:glycosyltransferase involved in cell wall biosynthesis
MPLISVIIPTFNRKMLLGRAVDSVLRQTMHDYELIVIDDGSTDGTRELPILADQRISFHRLPCNSGVSKARNFGVEKSVGEWVSFLDSDDEWFPQKLEKQIRWIMHNPLYKIVQTKEIWIRDARKVNPPLTHEKSGGDIFLASLERCMVTPSSVMLRRELFDEAGGFDETFQACEDYDLWLRIASHYPVGLVDEYLLNRYGGHSDQLSFAVMVLDKFRIRSMIKLLHWGNLTLEQSLAVRANVCKRSRIVANGFLKRGNRELYERFEFIAESYRS